MREPKIETVKCKCPKCKSKSLLIIEVWRDSTIEWATNEKGEFNINDGNLAADNATPYKIECECKDCDHHWTVKGVTQISNILKDKEVKA